MMGMPRVRFRGVISPQQGKMLSQSLANRFQTLALATCLTVRYTGDYRAGQDGCKMLLVVGNWLLVIGHRLLVIGRSQIEITNSQLAIRISQCEIRSWQMEVS